eukprot:3648772-Rhodomonas_salina.1
MSYLVEHFQRTQSEVTELVSRRPWCRNVSTGHRRASIEADHLVSAVALIPVSASRVIFVNSGTASVLAAPYAASGVGH